MQSIFNLAARGGPPLIAVHRGLVGGNIVGNTIQSFDAALLQGGDMVEMDVQADCEGNLHVFHGGLERAHLGIEQSLAELTPAQVKQLRFLNPDLSPTACPVHTLDEVLEHLKGRCYINIDKFALYMDGIAKAVRRHHMEDQVVVKTNIKAEHLDMLEEYAPDIAYIAIMKEEDRFTEELKKRRIRFIGVEAVFKSEESPICQPEYIAEMHRQGYLMWGNGIIYDYRVQLSAGHSDDISVCGDPDGGWGWLIDRGFDIIQTDWPFQLRHYINARAHRPA